MSQRRVVLDTETTGLSVEEGHRIIEIGCVEILGRRLTGRTLHLYLNPEREIDEGAQAVHGLTLERLAGEPRFADVIDRISEFVGGSELLIHNASFDLGFLEAEFRRAGQAGFGRLAAGVVDTLALARELHPGRRNSLDALCERYGVSNAHRKLHGALLDAGLLADVYLAMTRGQESLEMVLEGEGGPGGQGLSADDSWPPAGLEVLAASGPELIEHHALLARMEKETRKAPLWSAVAGTSAAG